MISSILITDTINHALNPVFSETLRIVICLHGVPRNPLSWNGFESLMAHAQLQHNTAPDIIAIAGQLASFQSPVVLPTDYPWNEYEGLKALTQLGHSLPAAAVHKQTDIAVDLSKLPPLPRSFRVPKDIKDCFEVAIACRDCLQKFLFTVTEQDFYIRTMEDPHFPVCCGPCRHHKKMCNNDPLSANATISPPSNLVTPQPIS